MSRERGDIARDLADRALDLHEKGLSQSAIAERLGVRPNNVGGMIERARQRREKRGARE
jgi:transcriptional regulator